MSNRRLNKDEAALWARVQRTAIPLNGRALLPLNVEHVAAPAKALKGRNLPMARSVEKPKLAANSRHDGLDTSWARKLTSGTVSPDFTIDLHGLSLDQAWVKLNRTLAMAIDRQSRIVLVITGRDRGPDVRTSPHARGRIRAKLADWIAASPYAGNVIAIKSASRRHGGDGALYLILRRIR